jgi:microcystin degradation protein MlrC
VHGRFRVQALSAGDVTLRGPMMTGLALSLGPCARLELEGISVLVSSGKTQLLDRELFRFLGVTPERAAILAVKSSVHFRADFDAIAHAILVAKAAGPMAADPADLPFTRLDEGTRTRPT